MVRTRKEYCASLSKITPVVTPPMAEPIARHPKVIATMPSPTPILLAWSRMVGPNITNTAP